MRRARSVLYPLLTCLVWAAGGPSAVKGQTAVTVYEGARLITGDGSAPIESSAFTVENGLLQLLIRVRGGEAVPIRLCLRVSLPLLSIGGGLIGIGGGRAIPI